MDLSRQIIKPPIEEFSYSARGYVRLISDDRPILEQLHENSLILQKMVLDCSEEQLLYRYAPDKWTIKEALVHLIDDERIYAYRALCFARNEKGILPGFNQDNYASYSEANDRSLQSILSEYHSVRTATLHLFNNLPEQALLRKGYADHCRVSVGALAYHIAAHELHHMNILKDKYLLILQNQF